MLNNCAPQATNTIDSGKLSKYEIEEELRSKIEIDKRLKTIGNKFNNEFLAQCKNKKNYMDIVNSENQRQLGGKTQILCPLEDWLKIFLHIKISLE